MRHTAVETRLGPVWLSTLGEFDPGPAVCLLHGAMRSGADMVPLAEQIPNCVVGHLPGHGVPALSETSLDAWGKAFAVAVATFFGARPILLVGESLGALVSLTAARFQLPTIGAVVAIDPPLSANPWPLEVADLRPELRSMFGHDHHDLVRQAQCPVTVLAATEPLLPRRELDRTPSLMSDRDRTLAAESATVIEIHGGHLLLTQSPNECLDIILLEQRTLLSKAARRSGVE